MANTPTHIIRVGTQQILLNTEKLLLFLIAMPSSQINLLSILIIAEFILIKDINQILVYLALVKIIKIFFFIM